MSATVPFELLVTARRRPAAARRAAAARAPGSGWFHTGATRTGSTARAPVAASASATPTARRNAPT